MTVDFAALVNKLVLWCAWLLSGTQEIPRLRFKLNCWHKSLSFG